MQDVGGFTHLYHERRATAGEVVRGTDASEYSVDGPHAHGGGGHEAADVGENHDECGLAHVRRLTTHVGAGDDEHPRVGVEQQIVCDERRVEATLHHRMTSVADHHAGFAGEQRTVEL